MFFTKIIISLVLSLLGSYYFYRGKKTGEIKLILWGIGLFILSYVIFVGDKTSDNASKTLINSMMPQSQDQQTPQ